MDPLDREKAWGVGGQLLVITLVTGVIYLVIRFAAIDPELGWEVVLPVTLVAAVLYYLLAFQYGFGRSRDPARRRGRVARAVTLGLLVAIVLLPFALALWLARNGAAPWAS